jgi:hypothetical protein
VRAGTATLCRLHRAKGSQHSADGNRCKNQFFHAFISHLLRQYDYGYSPLNET